MCVLQQTAVGSVQRASRNVSRGQVQPSPAVSISAPARRYNSQQRIGSVRTGTSQAPKAMAAPAVAVGHKLRPILPATTPLAAPQQPTG